MAQKKMLSKRSWNTFRNTGLLLIINQILHIFGWAIVFDFDKSGKLKEVYPARCKFRGFDNKLITGNYIKISKYMVKNSRDLLREAINK